MTQYDVVIIGAGAAGLGAAYVLRTKALKHLVLEADARAGGRAPPSPTITPPLIWEPVGCTTEQRTPYSPW